MSRAWWVARVCLSWFLYRSILFLHLGHCRSVLSSRLLVVPWLDSLIVPSPDRPVSRGGQSKWKQTQNQWTTPPPPLPHESGYMKDQVCPCSNKGWCNLFTSSFMLDTNFRPPSFHRHFCELMSSCLWAKFRWLMALPDPLVAENVGVFSSIVFDFTNLQTWVERVVDSGFHQRYQAVWRDQVCL